MVAAHSNMRRSAPKTIVYSPQKRENLIKRRAARFRHCFLETYRPHETEMPLQRQQDAAALASREVYRLFCLWDTHSLATCAKSKKHMTRADLANPYCTSPRHKYVFKHVSYFCIHLQGTPICSEMCKADRCCFSEYDFQFGTDRKTTSMFTALWIKCISVDLIHAGCI